MVLATSQQEFSDADFRVVDNGDQSKKLAFEVSGITAATTRTLTIPNASGTIALTSDLTSGYQPLDSDLTALAATATTSFGRGLLETSTPADLLAAGGMAFSLGTIADDTAVSLSYATGATGVAFIFGYNLGGNAAIFIARNAATANDSASLGTTGHTFSFGAGTLAGTTGTDGQVNIRAGSDGKIYVENRTGPPLTNAWLVALKAV